MRSLQFLMSFVSASLLLTGIANAGPISSGGGSSQTAEFFRIARGVGNVILAHKGEVAPPQFPHKELSQLLHKLQVEGTTAPLSHRGASVEALNFPDIQKVKFNVPAWEKRDQKAKTQLVVHELLGLLRLPDTQYRQSDWIAERVVKKIGNSPINAQSPIEYTADSKTTVLCEVRTDYMKPVIASFTLQPGPGVAHGFADFGDYHAEAAVSFEQDRQVTLSIRRMSENGKSLGSFGRVHAFAITNFIGDFTDAEIWGEQYALICAPLK